MKLNPTRDQIVVELKNNDATTQSGIVLVPAADQNVQKATVLAVGPDVKELSVGDTVVFTKNSAASITVDGKAVLIMREAVVLAIVEE